MTAAHVPLAALVECSLVVPSLPRITASILHPNDEHRRARHAHVFDAWAWCASDVLVWRRPESARVLDATLAVESENPPELAFVFHDAARGDFLPRELARFHARGYGLDEEWALAPYAIDDATDLLHERRVRPRDVLWLAASSLRALVWGLHDWAHFHNHGPFDEPAFTELECDLVALEWLRMNRDVAGVTDADVARVAADLVALSRARFAAEGVAPPGVDLDALFAGRYPMPIPRN
ncbi:MAG: hypothetical protein JWP97_2480 [Labilithrix sp.]|nr:hypothetical protein [Labilithrix sp.]